MTTTTSFTALDEGTIFPISTSGFLHELRRRTRMIMYAISFNLYFQLHPQTDNISIFDVVIFHQLGNSYISVSFCNGRQGVATSNGVILRIRSHLSAAYFQFSSSDNGVTSQSIQLLKLSNRHAVFLSNFS